MTIQKTGEKRKKEKKTCVGLEPSTPGLGRSWNLHIPGVAGSKSKCSSFRQV